MLPIGPLLVLVLCVVVNKVCCLLPLSGSVNSTDFLPRAGKASDPQKATERVGISSRAFLFSTEELRYQAWEWPGRVALGFGLL